MRHRFTCGVCGRFMRQPGDGEREVKCGFCGSVAEFGAYIDAPQSASEGNTK